MLSVSYLCLLKFTVGTYLKHLVSVQWGLQAVGCVTDFVALWKWQPLQLSERSNCASFLLDVFTDITRIYLLIQRAFVLEELL